MKLTGPSPVQWRGDRAYALSFKLSLAACILQTVSVPILVTFDGYWYAKLADILGTARFSAEWDYLRVPLFPALLKISFLIFGRQALAVAVLQSVFGFGGIWLLAVALKRLGHEAQAAFVMLLLSFYPTLVSYEHALLTETGTFFFLAALLYLLTAPVRSPLRRAFALGCVITLGYYHRSSLLYLSPVVAAVYAFSLWTRDGRPMSVDQWSLRGRAGAVLTVGLLPVLLAYPWQRDPRVSMRIGSVLFYGLIKQAVIPLDDPLFGPAAEDYRKAVQRSLVNNTLPLTGVQDQLIYRAQESLYRYDSDAGAIFLREITSHPGSYLSALRRTLLLYSGVTAPDTDSGSFIRPSVLNRAEALIAPRPAGFPPLDVELAQRTGKSLMARCLLIVAPIYDKLLFLSVLVSLALLTVGLFRRDAAQLAFAGIPLAFLFLNALVLNSQDRMVVPAYPVLLANLALLPGYLKVPRAAAAKA